MSCHGLKSLFLISCALALMAVSPAFAEATTDIKNAPSGTYQIDPSHTSVTFKVNHLGFSYYTGRFDKVEASLDLNSNTPEQSHLDVTLYPNSVDTDNAKLEEELRGDKWFDVIKYPVATFHATKIERTGNNTGKITGDFTLMGVTHTVVLDTLFVGTGTHPFTKKQVVGFRATAVLHRSDYRLTNLIPMVGDDVTLQIETEFNKAD